MDLFTQFILDHEQDDTGRLLLGRGKWPGIDMDLAVHTIEGRRRMRVKMPSWHAEPALRYPTRLCTEQCSSAATARYKARLAARILAGAISDEAPVPATKGGRIADLTGGLGVDAWAFCQTAEQVLHNEMDPVLSEAVRHNFSLLGISNAVFRHACAEPGRIGAILGDFHPDLIFLDPARRAEDGRKVFRIEDCRPDVLLLKDELLRHAPHLLLKISPMADISLAAKQLNPGLREVHVVEADGECKELLLWLDRSWDGPFRLVICQADRFPAGNPGGPADAGPAVLPFAPDAETRAVPRFADDPHAWEGGLLFEPGKALSKAGLFNTLCDGTGLLKLSRHTHLYLVSPAVFRTDPQKGTTAAAILSFGKLFRIKEMHPFDGKTAKAVGKAWPRADVTARDLPLSSEELRKRLGVVSGSAVHIFGCRVACMTQGGAPKDSARLIVAEPVSDRESASPVPFTGA